MCETICTDPWVPNLGPLGQLPNKPDKQVLSRKRSIVILLVDESRQNVNAAACQHQSSGCGYGGVQPFGLINCHCELEKYSVGDVEPLYPSSKVK